MKQSEKVPRIKKTVLISAPPTARALSGRALSTGILSIGSFLEKEGYPVEIIPLSYFLNFRQEWSSKEIEAVLKDAVPKYDPVIIGISNNFIVDYHDCISILKICKEINENAVTVIGGCNVSFLDAECIKSPFVDIVVRGEGEWTMRDLVSALESGTGIQHIKGITYKDGKNIIRNPDRPFGNLSELPKLNFGLMPYEYVSKAYIGSMLNRGCAFKCSFCSESAFWKNVRSFPVERVIEEMETLNHVYNKPVDGFDDSMLYVGSRQFSELFAEIKKRKITLNPDFSICTRADSIHDDGLRDIEGIGVSPVVGIGIESGSPDVLKMMNKKITPDQIKAACVKLKAHHLRISSFWIIGHPGDSPANEELSLELLKYLIEKKLLDEVFYSAFIPYPGTEFFEHPEKYGIEMLNQNWSEWYEFSLLKVPATVCQLKNFSAEEINAFNLRAHQIIKSGNVFPKFSTLLG